MAFDSGIFSFRDIYTSVRRTGTAGIFTLITNPKDILAKTRHEPAHKPLASTHIRLLIFSEHAITSAQVFVDETLCGEAVRATGGDAPPLYTVPWRPEEYAEGVHSIRAIVTVRLVYAIN
jgi:hypothetical protein